MPLVAPEELQLHILPSNILNYQDNVTLNCSAGGGPGNMFLWQKDGDNMTRRNDSTLELTFVTASAGGGYTCTVSNAAGSASINITIYIRLYFTIQPTSISTEVDKNHTLICEAEAFPEPTFEWFHAGRREFGINVTGMNTGTLMFTPVQFGDEGDYYCTATSNGESSNSSVATLSGGLVLFTFSNLTHCMCPNT